MGRTGVTKSCSRVPRSFSRTIEKAVKKVVTLRSRMAVRPGKKKFGEREAGLKSNLGRISTAKLARARRTRRSESSRAVAVGNMMGLAAAGKAEPAERAR